MPVGPGSGLQLPQPRSRSARAPGASRDELSRVYSEHATAIRNYLRVALRDDHDADEVMQQVFLNAFVAFANYSPDGPEIERWLITIAHNAALTHRRDNTRSSPAPDGELAAQSELRARRQGAHGPAWGTHDVVHDALLMLSRAQREVLVLRHLGGLSTGQIASFLDRTRDDIRQLEHRALAALRARLDDRVL